MILIMMMQWMMMKDKKIPLDSNQWFCLDKRCPYFVSCNGLEA